MNSSKATKGLFQRRGGTLICLGAFLALIGLALLVRGGPAAPAASADPADLALQKSDSPDPVNVGGQLTYTVTVANNGPDPATNVVSRAATTMASVAGRLSSRTRSPSAYRGAGTGRGARGPLRAGCGSSCACRRTRAA